MKDDPHGLYIVSEDFRGDTVTLPPGVDDPDGDEREVELETTPFFEEILVATLNDGRALIGYLVQDESCANPLEDCDGMGRIVQNGERRRYHDEVESEIAEALALDQYGQPDLDDKYLDRACQRLHRGRHHWGSMDYEQREPVDKLALELWMSDLRLGRIGNPHAVVLDYSEHGLCRWQASENLSDWKYDPDRPHRSIDGVWLPKKYDLEHIRYSAKLRFLPPGTTVEYRAGKGFSNRITYVLGGTGEARGGYDTFEAAVNAAARRLNVRFDRELLLKAERGEAFTMAEQACDVYTEWANGECYGYLIETFSPDGKRVDKDHDSCWGFVGQGNAKEALVDAMGCAVRHALKNPLPYTPSPHRAYHDPAQLDLLLA